MLMSKNVASFVDSIREKFDVNGNRKADEVTVCSYKTLQIQKINCQVKIVITNLCLSSQRCESWNEKASL